MLSLCLLLAACNRHKDDFVLEGTVAQEVGDTILVSGIDSRFARIDTIICRDGTLKWSFAPDTTTAIVLSLKDGRMHPVIAAKGQKALIDIPAEGTAQISVTGDDYNRVLQEFRRDSSEDQNMGSTFERMDSLIEADPFSPVLPYLIYEYGVCRYHASPSQLNTLISRLSGSMQDDPFISELKSRFPKGEKRTAYLNDIYLCDTAHTETNFSVYTRGAYKLVCIWASYDGQSIKGRNLIQDIARQYNDEDDIMFSDISIDTNLDRWFQIVESDTISIENLTSFCDTKGWNSMFIETTESTRLPVFILLSPQDRLIREYRNSVQICNAVDSVLLEAWKSNKDNPNYKSSAKKSKETIQKRMAELERRKAPRKLIY